MKKKITLFSILLISLLMINVNAKELQIYFYPEGGKVTTSDFKIKDDYVTFKDGTNYASYKDTDTIKALNSIKGKKFKLTKSGADLVSGKEWYATNYKNNTYYYFNQSKSYKASDLIAKLGLTSDPYPVVSLFANWDDEYTPTNTESSQTSSPVKAQGISIKASSTSIEVKEKQVLKITYSPSNAITEKITWSTSDKKIATISSSGEVTGVSKGTVTITATSQNGLKATQKITVVAAKNNVIIRYNTNGGNLIVPHGNTISEKSGNILKNENINVSSYKYGSTISSIANYNNKEAINIQRSGYTAKKGAEWNTKKDGTGKSYDQKKEYKTSDLCDASKNNCTVTLYVNWVKNTSTDNTPQEKNSYTITYNGKKYTVKGPKSLPQLTGRQGHDVILIAASQDGYKGATIGNDSKRLSYYSNIWARGELNKSQVGTSKGNWCSEFASWCARKAGVPASVYPAQTSYESFRNYFSSQGRFFKFSKGSSSKSWFSVSVAGTMTPSDLQEGDILQIAKKGANSPHHSAIFHKYDNGKIYTYDGNQSNEVEASGKGKHRSFDNIMAVIRPQYNDNLRVSAEKDSGGVRVRVAGLKPFTATKREYLVTISDTNINDYVLDYDRNSVLFNKESRFTSGKKYVITLRARYKSSGKIDNSFQPVTTTITY